ncbi:MAG: hypothetical protein AAGD05_13010 [Bacteroidota bacterium]
MMQLFSNAQTMSFTNFANTYLTNDQKSTWIPTTIPRSIDRTFKASQLLLAIYRIKSNFSDLNFNEYEK